MEISHGHHSLNPHARCQSIICPIGKGAALNALDANFKPLTLTGTNRIGSANFCALNDLAKGQILTLCKIKISCVVFRFEGNNNCVTNCIFDISNYQRMKFGHFTPSNAFEIVKGLTTCVAPPVRLARG